MKIINKIWTRNFELIEELEAGIALTGAEAKSLFDGRAKLEAAYVKLKNSEAVLRNMEIFRYAFDGSPDYDPFRPRKLLLNKKEILRWETKIASEPRLTIVPLSCYNKGRKIKVKIGLVRGRNDTQKRKLERGKEIKLKQLREAREWMKR